MLGAYDGIASTASLIVGVAAALWSKPYGGPGDRRGSYP
jgi:hypothetical protein